MIDLRRWRAYYLPGLVLRPWQAREPRPGIIEPGERELSTILYMPGSLIDATMDTYTDPREYIAFARAFMRTHRRLL
jgi:hypothetical protein